MRTILILFFSTAIALSAQAQCDPTDKVNECVQKIQGGFNFLKSYTVDTKGGSLDKIEYSYPFAKDTQYLLNLCGGSGDLNGVVITLYDANRKQIATSLINGQYLGGFAFNCQTTGIYYITFTFESSMDFCGGSTLGFKRG